VNQLRSIARQAMIERGLLPDFAPRPSAEADALAEPARSLAPPSGTCGPALASIDNDDSRDLDQLSVAEPLPAEG